MGIRTTVADDVVTIYVEGSFDVSVYEDFKDACQSNLTKTRRYVIDMANACYMDSSALGMLLLLREKTEGDKSRVKIINVDDTVQQILSMAQFQLLFVIETA